MSSPARTRCATRDCSRRAFPERRQPVLTRTSRRTAQGCSAVSCCAMLPPVETPSTSTGPESSAWIAMKRMGDLYSDDAAVDPIKVSYDRPAILGMAGEVRGKRVLDVGCASGALSEAFVERGASVAGVDLNPQLIERARGRLGSRAEFRVADIAAPMPFLKTGSFDVVAASLVMRPHPTGPVV